MARYEDKFLVPTSSFSEIYNIFEFDKINFKKIFPTRHVNSIYYDLHNLYFARQNLNGDGLREKIRIRFYDNNLIDANLEVKYKQYSVGKKQVVPIKLSHRLPNSRLLLSHLNEYKFLDAKQILELHPKLFIRYKRSYWASNMFKGIRITLDSNILAKQVSISNSLVSLFDHACQFQDVAVLEIKYDSQTNIDQFKKYFQICFNLRRSKFSKYMIGLIQTSQIT